MPPPGKHAKSAQVIETEGDALHSFAKERKRVKEERGPVVRKRTDGGDRVGARGHRIAPVLRSGAWLSYQELI
jgi:hypothetical protein